MAEQTSRRGGRSWFGKAQAKAAGRVTRRQDDRAEERRLVDETDYSELEMELAWPHGEECPACKAPNSGARHLPDVAECREEKGSSD